MGSVPTGSTNHESKILMEMGKRRAIEEVNLIKVQYKHV
jgi:hypothetical protein